MSHIFGPKSGNFGPVRNLILDGRAFGINLWAEFDKIKCSSQSNSVPETFFCLPTRIEGGCCAESVPVVTNNTGKERTIAPSANAQESWKSQIPRLHAWNSQWSSPSCQRWASNEKTGGNEERHSEIRHVSRISLREGPRLGGAPRLGGPETRCPRVPPIEDQKVCGFGPLFFSWGRVPSYFRIFTV